MFLYFARGSRTQNAYWRIWFNTFIFLQLQINEYASTPTKLITNIVAVTSGEREFFSQNNKLRIKPSCTCCILPKHKIRYFSKFFATGKSMKNRKRSTLHTQGKQYWRMYYNFTNLDSYHNVTQYLGNNFESWFLIPIPRSK